MKEETEMEGNRNEKKILRQYHPVFIIIGFGDVIHEYHYNG